MGGSVWPKPTKLDKADGYKISLQFLLDIRRIGEVPESISTWEIQEILLVAEAALARKN